MATQSSVSLIVNLKIKGIIQEAKTVIIDKIENERNKATTDEMKEAFAEKWAEAIDGELKLIPKQTPREPFQRSPPTEPVHVRGTKLFLKNIKDANNYRKFCNNIATRLNYASDFSDAPYYYRPKNARVYEAIKELYKNQSLTQEELDKMVTDCETVA